MESSENESEVFRCVDPWGREIVLMASIWEEHIVPDHAPLFGNEASVRLALTSPDLVMHDAVHPDRESFYRWAVLPSPYEHCSLKVCVEFRRATDPRGGRVVTAFPTKRIKPGEQRKVP